ncbi:MAG: TonB-dependent receptor [Acidobacteria bacterium]|nr:TonB-dependent receptor [Acidobacteriota bacterium]
MISDPSNAVVPNATVAATNVATGVQTSRQTTSAGFYTLSPLPAGEYTISVTAGGFQTLIQQHVVVDALSVVGLNLHLKLGATSQQVTVSSAPPVLDTSDASLGTTVRNEVYTSLPLAMAGNAPRNPAAFTQYMPGVTGSVGNTAGNVYGAQANSGDVYVEGMPITNPVLQGEDRNLQLGMSVEAVDQFQVETAGTAPMYQGQGSTNFVIKSGTNRFHGSAYEYLRNTDLDARGFFASVTPVEHTNEFGFDTSGPIVKNRIFFFGNYDGYRVVQGGQPAYYSLPTPAERTGDFSQLPVSIYDPLSTNCAAGPCTRAAFPGNVIPANRLSSASKFFDAPLPNISNAGIQNNFLNAVPVGYYTNNTTIKVDVNLNDKSQFYVDFSRGERGQSTDYRGQTLPLPYANTRLVNEVPTVAQAKYTYVFTPNLLNQLSYSFSRLWVPIVNSTIGGDWMDKAGVKGLPAGEAAGAFPEVAFGGPNSPTSWRGTNSRAFTEALNNSTLQDNVQWMRGKHAFTFGFQATFLQANEFTDAYGSLATWNFSNNQTAGFSPGGTLLTTTGNSFASYLLGALNASNVIQDSVVGTGGRYRDYSWWVNDTYKLTPRLTINLGIRHDIWSPYTEVLNRESFFNPNQPNAAAGGAPGILEFYGNGPDSCGCSTNVATDWSNFGPRVGVAYAIGQSSSTVVRAGYSLMYTHRGAVGGRVGARTGTGTVGFSATPSFTNSLGNNYTPAFFWDNGIPAYQQPPFFDPTYGTEFNGISKVGVTMQYGDPTLGGTPPHYQNWNFSIEHSFTRTLTMGVAYIGSNGHFLGGGGRGIWSDQINPAYLALGNLLTAPATAANIASASAIVPGIRLPFAGYSGSIAQMLRPYPQYPGISDLWGDVANSHYNSLQVTANKTVSHGLTFTFNYTYAKGMDDMAGSGSAYNWVNEKAPTQFPAHILNLLAVYQLPFGKGQRFAHSGILGAVAADWQLSSITTYRSGDPLGTIGAACNLPDAGGCYANYAAGFSGPVRINGGYGSGNLIGAGAVPFLNVAAFASPAAYTYGNTPRTGVFGLAAPGGYDEDVSLARTFTIHEKFKLGIRADAINVLNFVNFGGPNLSITSAGFGKITSQANSPRVMQVSARFSF